ncbi:MAG: ATP-binding cassette domain-containing protein, partial [Rhodoferax sp.]|nr:ATP-binding cassette domain-containing protein [Rhodoferax sp.]
MDALRRISEDHNNLWRLATALDQHADELAHEQPLQEEFVARALLYLEQYADRMHHPKEDRVLFPRLRQRHAPAAALIDRLQVDHTEGPRRLAELRTALAEAEVGSLALSALAQQVRSYTAGIKNHILLEERQLLPLARTHLLPEDWVALNAAFLDASDPVFGDQAQAEFRELYHRIVSVAPESLGMGGHAVGALKTRPVVTTSDVLLRVQDMQSCYGRIQALKGISLEVRRGETVALVGANGAGKTTFLRTLSGVQPMSAGSIQFDGQDISRLRADLRVRRGICQSPEGRQVFGPLTIEDNLRLGAYTRSNSEATADLARIFAMFPVLEEKRALPAGTLSGGQQQMLAIGRALMGQPRLLLLDEPSMGLAPLLVQEVFDVIRTLKAQGMTILLV